MTLSMRWVGEADFDRVAATRQRCYGPASKDLSRYAEGLRADQRAKEGDFLLVQRDWRDVGTATSLSLSMWMRGAKIPCQGVAWVGTIKTHRRGSRSAGSGIASQIMRETIRLGRERGQIISALMPFRASFYDHFGYGIVERMCSWTVPMAVIPLGEFESVRFIEDGDLDELAACRQRSVAAGQCDIERSPAGWAVYLKKWEDGWVAVDRDGDGPVRGYLAFQNRHEDGKDIVHVTEANFDDIATLKRLLHFLASLRDQYTSASLILPADFPLNRILRETQLPHRLVNHAHAQMKPMTRMSIRVLDHKRLIDSLQLPQGSSGATVVSVRENEGQKSRFKIELVDGKAIASPSEATADFECDDRIWAGIVSGDLPATVATKLGLVNSRSNCTAELLDAFSRGPLPFCQEYF